MLESVCENRQSLADGALIVKSVILEKFKKPTSLQIWMCARLSYHTTFLLHCSLASFSAARRSLSMPHFSQSA